MEDQSQSISQSPAISARQAFTEKVWRLLVSAYTDDLGLDLDEFLRQNHLNRWRVEKNLADFGHSLESARNAAILARRERRKELTRARNEKARADRLAEHDAYRKQKAEKERNESWDSEPLPEGMFIQFYPGKGDATPTYRGISVNFPDGTNLTLQECSAEEQKKALGKLIEKKNEKVRTAFVPKTEEERAEQERLREEERKARGNNGAKRNMHYEMTVEEKDVRPDDSIVDNPDAEPIGARQYVRYSMIPPRFIKTVYNNIAYRLDGTVYAGTVPATPFQNSNYEASCIAGIAGLRYIQSLPVERIVGYFQSHGFDLDKNTAHGLLKKAADLLDPLLKAMAGAVKGSAYIICDETYHKVLVNADDNEGRGSKKGYLWDMIAPALGLAYFFYDEGSRSEDVILNRCRRVDGGGQSQMETDVRPADSEKAQGRTAESRGLPE